MVGEGEAWEISVPSLQVCCEPKAALKKKKRVLKKSYQFKINQMNKKYE